MSGLLCVLPVLTDTYADACVASLRREDSAAGLKPEEILVVDNSRDGFCADRYGLPTWRHPENFNNGVARSWNVGVDRVLAEDIDYLVIMSSVMQFGPELHTTWRRQMEEFWGAKVIEADGHSFHLIAIHRSCFEKVGRFDPAYYPGYFEQVDWCRRLHVVGWEQGFVRVWVNALSQAVGGHLPYLNCPADPLLAHYAKRWGGPKGAETFVQPYGNKPLDYVVEEPIPVLAERYGLGARYEGWW